MEQTVGVRKRAEGGFGMTITEQGMVSAGGDTIPGGGHRMLGRKIVAVRGEVRQKPPRPCASLSCAAVRL